MKSRNTLAQAADEVTVAALHKAVFDNSCVAVLVNSVPDAEEEDDEEPEGGVDSPAEETLKQLEKIICPGYCSDRGNCVNGTCQCNEGKNFDNIYRYMYTN